MEITVRIDLDELIEKLELTALNPDEIHVEQDKDQDGVVTIRLVNCQP